MPVYEVSAAVRARLVDVLEDADAAGTVDGATVPITITVAVMKTVKILANRSALRGCRTGRGM